MNSENLRSATHTNNTCIFEATKAATTNTARLDLLEQRHQSTLKILNWAIEENEQASSDEHQDAAKEEAIDKLLELLNRELQSIETDILASAAVTMPELKRKAEIIRGLETFHDCAYQEEAIRGFFKAFFELVDVD